MGIFNLKQCNQNFHHYNKKWQRTKYFCRIVNINSFLMKFWTKSKLSFVTVTEESFWKLVSHIKSEQCSFNGSNQIIAKIVLLNWMLTVKTRGPKFLTDIFNAIHEWVKFQIVFCPLCNSTLKTLNSAIL